MSQFIELVSSSANYANPDEAISTNTFGVEFLGWEPGLGQLETQHEQYNFTHLRTPGGIPSEDPWSGDIEAGRIQDPTLAELQYGDFAYDLADDNFVDWYRWTGIERESIHDLATFAVENDVESISVVAPTARYAARMFNEDDTGDLNYQDSNDGIANSVGEAVVQAKADMLTFLNNYHFDETGAARDVPERLTLEIGSEYYETNLWRHFAEMVTPETQTQIMDNLTTSFGLVFAAQVEAVGIFEAEHGIEINTLIQLARTQSHDETVGSYANNASFIEQFQNDTYISPDAISAVDGGLWHRYYTFWGGLDDYLGEDDPESVQDMLAAWMDAGASGDHFVGGWMAPAVQANIADSKFHMNLMLQLYSELVSAGMDTGTAFATNYGSAGALAFKDDLMMGGQLYAMMAEHVPGTFVLDTHEDNVSFLNFANGTYSATTDSDDINVHSFANDDKAVFYLSVGNIADDGLDATFGLDGEYEYIEITHLFATGEPNWVTSNSGEETGYAGETYTQIISGGIIDQVTINFGHDFELVQIVAYTQEPYVEPVPKAADSGTVTVEILTMVASNVTIDLIEPKDAPMVLEGGQGNDTLVGGSGDDSLFGGTQSDVLEGGDGDDVLNGGFGHDVLIGGEGADVFLFEETFHNDLIIDFEVGTDTIDVEEHILSNLAAYQEDAVQTEEGLLLNLGSDGSILFFDVSVQQVYDIDFV